MKYILLRIQNRFSDLALPGIIILIILTIFTFFSSFSAEAAEKLRTGSGSFVFRDEKGDPEKPLTVYYYKPARFSENSEVLFLIHGINIDPQYQLNTWKSFADRNNVLLLAPEFNVRDYPKSVNFPIGNIMLPRDKWTFSAIEHLFDYAKDSTGNRSAGYYIFGHSAGGQFVHRMVIYMPDSRIIRAVAANAGWYAFPDFYTGYPYGLGSSPINESVLRISFSKKLIILLGDRDTDSSHRQLNNSKYAKAQGAHRMERGQNFFAQAQKEAKRLNTHLNWELIIVPGVGHSSRGMASEGEKVIFGGR